MTFGKSGEFFECQMDLKSIEKVSRDSFYYSTGQEQKVKNYFFELNAFNCFVNNSPLKSRNKFKTFTKLQKG